MVALIPPFFTSNLLALVEKICASSFDHQPLGFYSDRIRQIIVQCLIVNSDVRPDIFGVVQMCVDPLMTYTDGVCSTVQVLTHRLQQRHYQRDAVQFQSRCSFSSTGRTVDNVDDAEEIPRDRIQSGSILSKTLKIQRIYVRFYSFLLKIRITKVSIRIRSKKIF